MIKITNLKVNVEGKEILRGIDLTVKPAEIVAVMGPNGSGKSTLAFALAGHPNYEILKDEMASWPNNKAAGKVSEMELDGVEISDKSPDERANLGLFLANQYPVAIAGLTVGSFLWQLYKKRNKDKTRLSEFKVWLEKQAKALELKPELLTRGLNDGFSGGEKKKLEILQLLVFRPKYVILDEIDSGLDVDALRKIASTMAKVASEMKIGVLVITHYNRILKYLKPDRVVVLSKGAVVKSGSHKLALEIENSGYRQ